MTLVDLSLDELGIIFAALGRVSDNDIPGAYRTYKRFDRLLQDAQDKGKAATAVTASTCTRKGN